MKKKRWPDIITFSQYLHELRTSFEGETYDISLLVRRQSYTIHATHRSRAFFDGQHNHAISKFGERYNGTLERQLKLILHPL